MIHAVETTAFMLSQKIGETRTQEELASIIRAQNEKERITMAAPKKPQDHKPKAEKNEVEDTGFSFEVDGKTYTLNPATGNFNRGFYRRIRKESELDQMFSIVELLAPDEETLDAFDNIPDDDFKDVFAQPFNAYFKSINGGTSVGESSAS